MHINDNKVSERYKQYLRSNTWQAIRERILLRDNQRCQMCGSTKDLRVHHMNSKYRFHEQEHPEQLIVLCENCHTWIHTYWNTCDEIKSHYAQRTHQENMRKGYY